jgi:hypothetical protein
MTSYFTRGGSNMWDKLAKLNPPPAVRRGIYIAVVAAGPLLTYYGVVDDQEWALWVNAAGMVLGGTTAALNVADAGDR